MNCVASGEAWRERKGDGRCLLETRVRSPRGKYPHGQDLASRPEASLAGDRGDPAREA